ncbi:MAG: four helix bundle protein [bacterium]
MAKIISFTDLEAWREGHKLVLEIYKLTATFPKEESFCLTSQIRRAAVSVTSNIAEGFSRRSYKDKIHFYFMALGSVTELQNQLLVSRDLSYISRDKFMRLSEISIKVHKLLNGLIKSSRKRV